MLNAERENMTWYGLITMEHCYGTMVTKTFRPLFALAFGPLGVYGHAESEK